MAPSEQIEKQRVNHDPNDYSGSEKALAVLGILGLLIVVAFVVFKIPAPDKITSGRDKRLENKAVYDYTIISKSKIGSLKCVIDVRLNTKLSKSTLYDLAHELRNKESIRYDRFFILYYLPGMKPGHGAWATTHFRPNLEVRIIGQ